MNNGKILYRVNLENNKQNAVTIKQSGGKLTISLEGFDDSVKLEANSGGASACRTIIEHHSDKADVIISLPIPSPRARCRMLPGFVSIESKIHKISLDEAAIDKISGNDTELRKVVEKTFGKIE